MRNSDWLGREQEIKYFNVICGVFDSRKQFYDFYKLTEIANKRKSKQFLLK